MAQRPEEIRGTQGSSNFGDDKPWKCHQCNFMLGLVSQDGKILRIKYKDLYLSVVGGRVEVLCRKCGRVNVLEYTPDGGEVAVTQNLRYAASRPSGARRKRR